MEGGLEQSEGCNPSVVTKLQASISKNDQWQKITEGQIFQLPKEGNVGQNPTGNSDWRKYNCIICYGEMVLITELLLGFFVM